MFEAIYNKFKTVIAAILIIIILWLLYFIYIKLSHGNHSHAEYELMNGPRNNINYMDGVDVIYWINLDRSTDRRATMTRVFQDDAFNNVPIERVAAVDGKDPKSVYPRLSFMYKQKNDYEYACMLSHLDTILKFSRSDLPVALIMEDDVTLELKKYWRKSVREIIANAPPDWEIIQLCYITQNNLNRFNLYERNVHNKTVSAAAYLIKNTAAKRLVNSMYKDGKYELENYIIHHADCYIFNKTVTYTYKYPLFIYRTGNDSLLHPQDLSGHERSKMQIVKMYSNLVG